MQTFLSISHPSPRPCVVALGCFDGVHMGHREVISTAKRIAEKMSLPLDVFTFSIPPRSFFSPVSVPLITSTEDKLDVLSALEVDRTYCLTPSKEIFSVSATDFIEKLLIKDLGAMHVVCGFNYTFGKGGLGNTDLLREICASRGVGVSIVDAYNMDGVAVSSSLIRETVARGDMSLAAKYLGRPFSLRSRVVNGQHLARKLGFPTVNIIPAPEILLPKNAVYVTRISFDETTRYGITNVGMRPTVDTNILCAETHLFDFDGDLYGKEICVEFLKFIRPETKFSSVEQMAEQVKRDILTAKEYLKSINDGSII